MKQLEGSMRQPPYPEITFWHMAMGDLPTSSAQVNDFATESVRTSASDPVAWAESSCGNDDFTSLADGDFIITLKIHITWEWWLQCWRHPTSILLNLNGSGAYHLSSLWACARWLWQLPLLHELRVAVLLFHGAVRRAPRLAEIVPTLNQFKMSGWRGWVSPAFTRFVSSVCQMQRAHDQKWASRCGEMAIFTDVCDVQRMLAMNIESKCTRTLTQPHTPTPPPQTQPPRLLRVASTSKASAHERYHRRSDRSINIESKCTRTLPQTFWPQHQHRKQVHTNVNTDPRPTPQLQPQRRSSRSFHIESQCTRTLTQTFWAKHQASTQYVAWCMREGVAQHRFHWSMNWTTRCVCNPWSMGYLDFATG